MSVTTGLLLGELTLRPAAAWLARGVVATINELAEFELGDVPARGPLSAAHLESRAQLVRRVATTKSFAEGALAALAGITTADLPILRIEAEPGAGARIVLVYNDERAQAQPDALEPVLRWMLKNASDAAFARYDFQVRENRFGKIHLVDGVYTLVTRDGLQMFDDRMQCDIHAMKVMERHRANTADQAPAPPAP